jgi:hypothetical protein
VGITFSVQGLKDVEAKIKAIFKGVNRKPCVEVGVLEGASTAPRAFYNEFGTTHIPGRPALRNTIQEKSGRWGEIIGQGLKGKIQDPNAIIVALGQTGEAAKADFSDMIGSGVGPALAESTVKRKQAKGIAAADLQLVETGEYQRSIDYVTHPNGK